MIKLTREASEFDFKIEETYSPRDWEIMHRIMLDPRVEKVWENEDGEYILKVLCTGKYLKVSPKVKNTI